MNKKALFVDDEEAILEIYETLCEQAGYQAYSTTDVYEALKLIEKENIQVMFFDLKMPEINGIDLCRKVREKNRIALIYAVTGYTSLFQLSECREAGFDDYFTKPFEMELLTSVLKQSFEKMQRWSKR